MVEIILSLTNFYDVLYSKEKMKRLVIGSKTYCFREKDLIGHGRDRYKANDGDIICYFCKDKGHKKKDYPKQQDRNKVVVTDQKGQPSNSDVTSLVEEHYSIEIF